MESSGCGTSQHSTFRISVSQLTRRAGKAVFWSVGLDVRSCCGLSVEYGRYNLGAVRDESVWRYSITLKNIITAGNLNRAVSLF